MEENNMSDVKALPTQDEIWLMSEQYSNDCGLKNFFNEDEILIIRNHWCNGFTRGIKIFLNSEDEDEKNS
jgi:hypothetical protein